MYSFNFNLYRLLYKDRKGLYSIVSLLRGFSLTLKMFILLTAEHLALTCISWTTLRFSSDTFCFSDGVHIRWTSEISHVNVHTLAALSKHAPNYKN